MVIGVAVAVYTVVQIMQIDGIERIDMGWDDYPANGQEGTIGFLKQEMNK